MLLAALVEGADPNDGAAMGTSPLHYACGALGHGRSNPQAVRALIAAGALVNAAHPLTGAMPLHAACASHDRDACAALVYSGADVNAVDREGLTPLHALACDVGVLGWPSGSRLGSRPTDSCAASATAGHPHTGLAGDPVVVDTLDASAMQCACALLVHPGVDLGIASAVRGATAEVFAWRMGLPGLQELLRSEVGGVAPERGCGDARRVRGGKRG